MNSLTHKYCFYYVCSLLAISIGPPLYATSPTRQEFVAAIAHGTSESVIAYFSKKQVAYDWDAQLNLYPLAEIIKADRLDVLKGLAKKRLNLHRLSIDKKGITLLDYAIAYNQPAIITYLVQQGAPVSLNLYRYTALQKVVNFFLCSQAPPNIAALKALIADKPFEIECGSLVAAVTMKTCCSRCQACPCAAAEDLCVECLACSACSAATLYLGPSQGIALGQCGQRLYQKNSTYHRVVIFTCYRYAPIHDPILRSIVQEPRETYLLLLESMIAQHALMQKEHGKLVPYTLKDLAHYLHLLAIGYCRQKLHCNPQPIAGIVATYLRIAPNLITLHFHPALSCSRYYKTAACLQQSTGPHTAALLQAASQQTKNA